MYILLYSGAALHSVVKNNDAVTFHVVVRVHGGAVGREGGVGEEVVADGTGAVRLDGDTLGTSARGDAKGGCLGNTDTLLPIEEVTWDRDRFTPLVHHDYNLPNQERTLH